MPEMVSISPAQAAAPGAPRKRRRVLLLVLDGMRPSSINPRLTPNLARLAGQGVTFTRSRTGFPSETMVGAGELFAGAYPEASGVTSNWAIIPGADAKGVELKSLAGVQKLADGFGGRALASTSVFEALAGAGLTSAIIGKEGPAELAWLAGATWSVSSGGAHETDAARAIGSARGAQPLATIVTEAAGEAPKSGEHDDAARSTWLTTVAGAVDAKLAPDLLAIWLTDPDKTQHGHGLGTVNQRDALLAADRAVGALLDDLRRRGTLDDLDIVITSDHGFSEHLGKAEIPLAQVLANAGLDVSHVVASGNQHLVRFRVTPTEADFAKLRDAIAASDIAPLVRTVISNPRAVDPTDRRGDARLTGRDLRNGSERAADAFVIYQRDERGVPGPRSRGGRGPAHVPAHAGATVAGHGSMGWSDLNNTLVLAGPSVERARAGAAALRTPNAAGIVDVSPTILHLLGVTAPASMRGRVLEEALVQGGRRDGRVRRRRSRTNVAWTDVQLGARLVRTGLVTEQLGASSYFVGLETSSQRG